VSADGPPTRAQRQPAAAFVRGTAARACAAGNERHTAGGGGTAAGARRAPPGAGSLLSVSTRARGSPLAGGGGAGACIARRQPGLRSLQHGGCPAGKRRGRCSGSTAMAPAAWATAEAMRGCDKGGNIKCGYGGLQTWCTNCHTLKHECEFSANMWRKSRSCQEAEAAGWRRSYANGRRSGGGQEAQLWRTGGATAGTDWRGSSALSFSLSLPPPPSSLSLSLSPSLPPSRPPHTYLSLALFLSRSLLLSLALFSLAASLSLALLVPSTIVKLVSSKTIVTENWLGKPVVTEDKGFGKRGGGVQGLPLWSMYPARDGKIARTVAVSERYCVCSRETVEKPGDRATTLYQHSQKPLASSHNGLPPEQAPKLSLRRSRFRQ
jgi:hypothetical protein